MVLTLSLPEFSCLSKLRGGSFVEAANAALALLRIAHAEPSSHMRIAVHALPTVLRGLLVSSGSSQETVLLKLSLFFLLLAMHTTAFVVACAWALAVVLDCVGAGVVCCGSCCGADCGYDGDQVWTHSSCTPPPGPRARPSRATTSPRRPSGG